MYPQSRSLRAARLAAGPFILIALAVSVFLGHLPGAVLVLGLAALPSVYSIEIPTSPHAAAYLLRAGLVVASDVAVVAVLVVERSALPQLATIAAIAWVLVGLPAATFDVLLAVKPAWRRQLYERRRARGWPTTTRI